MSVSRPLRAAPPRDAPTPRPDTTTNAAQTGSPGTAKAAVPIANAKDRPLISARGGSRSDADSSVAAPITWVRDGPNMASADSSGEPVAA